jgi:hypothetical protein
MSESHGEALDEADAVVAFNAAVEASERFDGLHHDIEPHVLRHFWTVGDAERLSIMTQYVTLVDKVMSRLEGRGVKYGVDIAFWYDGFVVDHGKRLNVAEHLIDRGVDLVTLMSYRNTAAAIIGLGKDELRYATSIGRRSIVLGVETMDYPPAHVTFANTSWRYMEGELDQVTFRLGAEPGFLGMAIHHYDPFRTLVAR